MSKHNSHGDSITHLKAKFETRTCEWFELLPVELGVFFYWVSTYICSFFLSYIHVYTTHTHTHTLTLKLIIISRNLCVQQHQMPELNVSYSEDAKKWTVFTSPKYHAEYISSMGALSSVPWVSGLERLLHIVHLYCTNKTTEVKGE